MIQVRALTPIFGNGAGAFGIGKTSSVLTKIGKICFIYEGSFLVFSKLVFFKTYIVFLYILIISTYNITSSWRKYKYVRLSINYLLSCE